ncbi:MAG: RsmE family RNA methyltransferase [Opitutaceae bacterium]|nr:RsmE family RNA methyltransferase [Opitutaceae bacterium]
MNLILFESAETARPLPCRDPRAAHLLQVLRRRQGDTFDAGLINGPRGKGTLAAIGPDALTLVFTWEAEPPPLDPITLIIGLPRPQTARDILRDATSLGVAAMHFVATGKGESGYAQSTLWSSGEWRRHLIAGAEQAFDTRLPEVTHGRPLLEVAASLSAGGTRVAFDNYEAALPLEQLEFGTPPHPPAFVLAVGAERGWSAADRTLLRGTGFVFAHLGPRVLRTETAVTAAVTLLKARLRPPAGRADRTSGFRPA